MGHGGTLDPLATGVLIVGIGRGTKHLNNFLGCTKTYETVVLFGKSSDTYDIAGRIVADAPSTHVTKSLVEEKMAHFRGNIKQVPPIYSALKIQGIKAYEYARSGREMPRELESRDMVVEECSLLKWYDVGQHNFRWPAEEATREDKITAQKLMNGAETTKEALTAENTDDHDSRTVIGPGNEQIKKPDPTEEQTNVSKNPTEQVSNQSELNSMAPADKAALHTHHLPEQSDMPADAPAARIRLTVSSGFYVRSFAHDLGIACNSFAMMAELLRSRQGDFTCTQPPDERLIPCLTYLDLEQGEEVWGPKVTDVLEKWLSVHPEISNEERRDDRDNRDGRYRYSSTRGRPGSKRKWNGHDRDRRNEYTRRNSSSPE